MKRRVAIILSGRIQISQDIIENNLIKMIRRYNPVVFCSLNKTANTDDFIIKFKELVEKECKCIINIEDTKVPDEIFLLKKAAESIYNNVYSMYYHNKKGFSYIKEYELKNNIKFDIIIKYRSDLENENIIDLDHDIVENTVYIPKDADWGGLNDQIGYGDIESMEKYCKCVDNIIDMCKNQGITYHPETLLLNHIKKMKLNIERVNFKYNIVKKK
jgi:hypothetical protein